MVPRAIREIWTLRNILLVVLTPVILLPLPLIVGNPESRCAYILIVMAVYWTTDAIPAPMTGLMPVLLFPITGILSVKDLAYLYVTPVVVMYVCTLMVAAAVEHWNLHRRIALRMMLLFGTDPSRLMLGVMVPTWFLSMWISNTATTAMMTPILVAILDQLENPEGDEQVESGIRMKKMSNARYSVTTRPTVEIDNRKFSHSRLSLTTPPTGELGEKKLSHSRDSVTTPPTVELGDEESSMGGPQVAKNEELQTDQPNAEEREKGLDRMGKALSLSVAYAANVGGTTTIIGTGPNIVLLEITDSLYEQIGGVNPINFGSWFVFGLPVSVLCFFLVWFWLQICFLGCNVPKMLGFLIKFADHYFRFYRQCRRTDYSDKVKGVVKAELDKLGSFTFAEFATLLHFIVLVLLWFTRAPRFMPGWGDIFTSGYVKNACVAVLIATIMFIFPSRVPRIFCCRKKNEPEEVADTKPLLTWDVVQHGVPWMIIWLLGGGFALAAGFKVELRAVVQASGLSAWIAQNLQTLGQFEPWVTVLLLTIIGAVITEVTQNVAVANLILPILLELALKIGTNPLYIMYPVALATSFAFMLPVATMPNAIVYSTGRVNLRDMMKAGLMLNILCVAVVNIGANTWAASFFDFNKFPQEMTNFTFTQGKLAH